MPENEKDATAAGLEPRDTYVFPLTLEHNAKVRPDAPFMHQVDSHSVTFAEAHEAALKWSDAHRRAGAKAGEPVLTMLPTSIEAVLVWLGLGWLNVPEVPINSAYRGDMLRHIVNDCTADTAVISGRFLPRFMELAGDFERLRRIVLTDERPPADTGPFEIISADEYLAGATADPADRRPDATDVAAIVYTSGTTGPSKGVMVPWRQLHETGAGVDANDDFGPEDVFYSPLPLFHIAAKAMAGMMSRLGGQFVVRERFSTSSFWADVDRYGVTTSMLLGGMITFLEAQDPEPGDAEHPLRNALCIPLPADVDRFRERFGVRVHTWFGMTEVGVPIAVPAYRTSRDVGCGVPRPGYQARIVDDEDRDVPVGEVGELVLRADEPGMLNAGYWNLPDRTAEAWRNLWLHTGDAMRQDESGNLHFVDRWKDAIRRRGENISTMEVEAGINQHPDVYESAVVGVPSEWSEDEVFAYVVPKPNREIDPVELIEFLIPRMPHFMIPRYLEIVESLPKTPTEKVRKVDLPCEVGPNTWDREAHGIVIKEDQADRRDA